MALLPDLLTPVSADFVPYSRAGMLKYEHPDRRGQIAILTSFVDLFDEF
jgi:hypothetical protein